MHHWQGLVVVIPSVVVRLGARIQKKKEQKGIKQNVLARRKSKDRRGKRQKRMGQ